MSKTCVETACKNIVSWQEFYCETHKSAHQNEDEELAVMQDALPNLCQINTGIVFTDKFDWATRGFGGFMIIALYNNNEKIFITTSGTTYAKVGSVNCLCGKDCTDQKGCKATVTQPNVVTTFLSKKQDWDPNVFYKACEKVGVPKSKNGWSKTIVYCIHVQTKKGKEAVLVAPNGAVFRSF